ncbi:diacylglycerol O-acyltransferase 2D-like isoform X1 [Cicer arietinum]|uniref:Acyltransferase n=1 Tax=Cicer arietinum TaxID=3827 RepID=A0A3Q7XFZ6_CICAR|nr:diacylglycerol O-acyltransferase 2D-like isoform X1 [Cicer arietinum]
MEKVLGRENAEHAQTRNSLKSVVALALCFGAIHFNLAFILFSLFFLPLSLSPWVIAFLMLFTVLPVDKNSLLGLKLSRFICKHVCTYFPITLHVEDAEAFHLNRSYGKKELISPFPYQPFWSLDEGCSKFNLYIRIRMFFCYEPHSVFPFGSFALHNNTGFMRIPKIRFLVSSAAFYIPFLRQIWTWLGFSSVTKQNVISLLASGYSCIIVPGGTRETLFMEHGCENVYLKERRGFVRLAMEMGHPLVPVFCFGQTNIYKWWKAPGKLIQSIARSMKIFPLIFWGRFGTPVPFKNPLYVVVGRPIQLEKTPQPTSDQVAKVHSEFIEALQDLFERHKVQAGYENLELKIV